MEAKWTPGPWETRKSLQPSDGAYDYAIAGMVEGDGPHCIAEVFGRVAENIYSDGEANAHLISAAPELYESLFCLFNFIAMQKFEVDAGAPPIIKDGIYDKHINAARAALAKARGNPDV